MNISKNIPGFTSLKNGCTRSPGAPRSSPDVGCPALVQQGECWPNTAPCGVREPDLLAKTDLLGVPFSQNAWAAAQQEGCLGCPDRYPKWPPPTILPTLDIPHQTMAVSIAEENPNFHLFETPFLQSTVEMGLKQQIPDSLSTIQSWIPSWPEAPQVPRPGQQMSQEPPEVPEPLEVPEPPEVPLPPGQQMSQVPDATRNKTAEKNNYKNWEYGASEINYESGDDDFLPDHTAKRTKKNNLKQKIKILVNSLNAIFYDLKHWQSLENMSCMDKLKHIFLRDERAKHLAIFILICALLTFLINSIVKQ